MSGFDCSIWHLVSLKYISFNHRLPHMSGFDCSIWHLVSLKYISFNHRLSHVVSAWQAWGPFIIWPWLLNVI